MERPNIPDLLQAAAAKYQREQTSATARAAKAAQFQAAADTDFADAKNAQMAARQGELATKLFDVAEGMGDAPELLAARAEIEKVAMSLYQQGVSLAAASDQADPTG